MPWGRTQTYGSQAGTNSVDARRQARHLIGIGDLVHASPRALPIRDLALKEARRVRRPERPTRRLGQHRLGGVGNGGMSAVIIGLGGTSSPCLPPRTCTARLQEDGRAVVRTA